MTSVPTKTPNKKEPLNYPNTTVLTVLIVSSNNETSTRHTSKSLLGEPEDTVAI